MAFMLGRTEWLSFGAWVEEIVLCVMLRRHDWLPPHPNIGQPACSRCGRSGDGAAMSGRVAYDRDGVVYITGDAGEPPRPVGSIRDGLVRIDAPSEHVVTRINDGYYVCDVCAQAGSERWAILHQFPVVGMEQR